MLAACAQAGQGQPVDADTGQPIDARTGGPADARADGMTVSPPDARPDAYQCTPMARQLLVNPVFDLDANGTGWTQQLIDPAGPLITGDGIPEHSAPYEVWLGGLIGLDYGVQTVTDVIYQDVAIPAGTTQLVLTGQYAVGTDESGGLVYDTASVELIQTNGTPIESVIALNNTTTTANWVPLSKTFTSNVAGQTVRLRMTSTNDDIYATSFFFDTFALTATVCQ
ncbi:MAG: hypothetical protein HOV81_27515 [Kofleriaceae bacterium]|nr:hypothetical protein [Kofleriaceae bacterium]